MNSDASWSPGSRTCWLREGIQSCSHPKWLASLPPNKALHLTAAASRFFEDQVSLAAAAGERVVRPLGGELEPRAVPYAGAAGAGGVGIPLPGDGAQRR